MVKKPPPHPTNRFLSQGAGRLPEAISHLEAAVRIRPDMQPWRQILAQLRAAQR